MKTMTEKDRLCYLMFDEMNIKENLRYDQSLDIIEGVEDRGHLGRTAHYAKFGLVFMLRGLMKKWKQPVALYFSAKGMPSSDLKVLIEKVLLRCRDAGCIVLATVCDMGPSNRGALKMLGSSPTRPFFNLIGQEVVTLYDAPHLLKCCRNALINYDIECSIKDGGVGVLQRGCARWEHIVSFYKQDSASFMRCVKKLTQSHVMPSGREKMKVKLAAQVLSDTVAAHVYRAVTTAHLPPEALATSSFLKICNDIFDSLNGLWMGCTDASDFRHGFGETSGHLALWKEAEAEIRGWVFVPKVCEDTSRRRRRVRTLPFQKGLITTMNGMKHLLQLAKPYGVTHLSPRAINQDAVENLFGLIRSHCGCNYRPTMYQFISALKTCIMNDLAYCDISSSANCLSDDASILSSLKTFICGSDIQPTSVPVIDTISSSEQDADATPVMTVDNSPLDISMERVSVAYVAGFVARRVLKEFSCAVCKMRLLAGEPDVYLHGGISSREYTPDQLRLTYPCEDLVNSVAQGVNIVDEMLNANRHMPSVLQSIKKTLLQKVELDWLNVVSGRESECMSTGTHNRHLQAVKDTICHVVTKIAVPWWCKVKNRENKYGDSPLP